MLRRRSFPQGRARVQSRWLVAVVGAALGVCGVCVLFISGAILDFRAPVALGCVLSLTFGYAAWRVGAATKWAAVCGGWICLLLLMTDERGSGNPLRSGMMPLMILFVLTFVATRLGRQRKAVLGVAEDRRGRNAAQVLANLGAAGLAVGAGWLGWLDGIKAFEADSFVTMRVLVMAALCEATADTVSSEIGQGFGGTPFLLTKWRRVKAGTDGAVSLLGTWAGVAAAAVVALVGIWPMGMSRREARIGLAAGVAGMLFDSVLGGTVERKRWLGNDLVNFLSTLFAVAVALAFVVVIG